MARPIGGRLSEVFRQAYLDAGLTQTDIEARLHERGFTNIDQPLVSKWARGMRPIPIDLLPVLDEILGQRRGYLLRLAGYVEDLDAGAGGVYEVNRDDPDEMAIWSVESLPPAARWRFVLEYRRIKGGDPPGGRAIEDAG